MKFKVGDKVKIINHGSAPSYTLNKIGIIKNIFYDHYDIDVVKETWSYSEEKLEPALLLEELNNFNSQKKVSGAMEAIYRDYCKVSKKQNLTLPTDSNERKAVPLFSGCIKYFPAALAGVARLSKKGNDKHNAGQELHHARGKSMDHADCIVRHLTDVADLLAKLERGEEMSKEQLLEEASSLVWRALAFSQELHEKHDGAPMAPGAKLYK